MKKKLAELLIDRKVLADRLNALTPRLHNAVVAPKDSGGPVEEFQPLLDEFMKATEAYAQVDGLIAKSNQQAKVVGSSILMVADAIIQRDLAKRQMSLLTSLVTAAGETNQRRYRDDTPMVPVVPIKTLQAQVDELAKTFRKWDVLIQQTNWSIEVELPY